MTSTFGIRPRAAGVALLLAALCSAMPAAATPVVGTAMTVVREVSGTVEQQVRTLVVDSDVFQNETVTTGENSATRIIFKDGTKLSLGEKSELKLTRLVFDPDPAKSRIAVKAMQGVFRWTSGNLPSQNYGIASPVGTIGVRGTTIEMVVLADGTTYVLLAQGAAEVSNLLGASVLLRPGQATLILPPDADGWQPPPTPPEAPPAEYADLIRKMTITLRMAELDDISPAAGPGFVVALSYSNNPAPADDKTAGDTTTPPIPPNLPQRFGQTSSGGSQGFSVGAPPVVITPVVLPPSNPGAPAPQSPGGPAPASVPPNTITGTIPATDGAIRIGSDVSFTVSRDPGTDGVLHAVFGTSPLLTGPGSGPAGVDVGAGQGASFDYQVTPPGHGAFQATVGVTLSEPALVMVNGQALGNITSGGLSIVGTAVGPELGGSGGFLPGAAQGQRSDATLPGEIAFGTMAPGLSKSYLLTLGNVSGDLGFERDLVGLTILGFLVSNWTDHFELSVRGADGLFHVLDPSGAEGTALDFALDAVLLPGESIDLLITYFSLTSPGLFHATLSIFTDQDAPFCGDVANPLTDCRRGLTTQIALSGGTDPLVVAVPEPASLAILVVGLAAGGAARRRQRTPNRT